MFQRLGLFARKSVAGEMMDGSTHNTSTGSDDSDGPQQQQLQHVPAAEHEKVRTTHSSRLPKGSRSVAPLSLSAPVTSKIERCLEEKALSLKMAEDIADYMLDSIIEDENNSTYVDGDMDDGKRRSSCALRELERIDEAFADWKETNGDLGEPFVQTIIDRIRAAAGPMAKRPPVDSNNNKQDERKIAARRGGSSSSSALAVVVGPPALPLPRLPLEMLSHAFTFLDMKDIPAASAASTEWKAALDRAEDELWLNLIRRYHPTVEAITSLLAGGGVGVDNVDVDGGGESSAVLPPPPAAAASSRNAAASAGTAAAATAVTAAPTPTASDAGTQQSASLLPAPSLNWKRQFQRRHALLRKAEADKVRAATSVVTDPPPKPRPLSAYIAQVDFTCYVDGDDGDSDDESGVGGGGDSLRRKVGIVSTVVTNLKFNKDKDKVELNLDDLRSQFVRMKKFDSFDIAVSLIDRATGRQSLVFNGELDQFMSDEDEFYFGSFDDFDIVPLLNGMPDSSLDSCVWLHRRGCVCRCEDLTVFNPSTCRCKRCGRSHCCTCKAQWSCFYRFVLLLEIRLDVEVDFVELGRNYLLTVLQEGLVYS